MRAGFVPLFQSAFGLARRRRGPVPLGDCSWLKMIPTAFVAGVRDLSPKSKTMLTKTAIQSARYAARWSKPLVKQLYEQSRRKSSDRLDRDHQYRRVGDGRTLSFFRPRQ